MKIDVVVLTKNSEQMLEKCLDSIYDNIPVNRLIVIDGHSTDRTLPILHKYREKYQNSVLVSNSGTRATARQRGIELVKTDWFMFVDSDVILCEGWYKRAEKLIAPQIGAIWGVDLPADPQTFHRAKLKINVKGLTLSKMMIANFHIRGGTHDILIRTEAVKGLKIPRDLHLYEDAFIKNWIENKGYKTLAVESPYCEHYRFAQTHRWNIKEGILSVTLEIKYRIMGYRAFLYLLKNFLITFPKAVSLYLARNKKAAAEQWDLCYYLFLGDVIRTRLQEQVM